MTVHAVEPSGVSRTMALSVDKFNWALALVGLCDIKTNEMSQNCINFNAAISSCEKSGRWAFALHLMDFLRKGQLKTSVTSGPDVITLSTVLSACEKSGQWHVALLLLSQTEFEVSEISFNAAISACEKLQRWQLSADLLRRIFDLRLQATEISYNAVISACHRAQEMHMRQLSQELLTV